MAINLIGCSIPPDYDQYIKEHVSKCVKEKKELDKTKPGRNLWEDPGYIRVVIKNCNYQHDTHANELSHELKTLFAYATNFILIIGIVAFLFKILSSSIPRELKVSNTRKTKNDALLDSDRFKWVIANCKDIRSRNHICKNDYQTFFRELGFDYIKHYEKNGKKIYKQEVIDLLTWSISVIDNVYKGKSKNQGEKRKEMFLEFIEKIRNL